MTSVEVVIVSRFCGEKNTAPILAAAARWRDVALLGEGSVLTDQRVWTGQALDALDRYFVQNLDEGEGSFIEKLRHQIADAPPVGKKLAAEMMWLMYLCPSGTYARHKRKVLQEIWEWSDEPLPRDLLMLADDVLAGVGSAGPAFNVNQWRELVFLIRLTRAFRALSVEDRKTTLSDGWKFAQWMTAIEDWEARQLRHMLLFLLFPDQFERVFGQVDRKKIVEAFTAHDADALDPLGIDRALSQIRGQLEVEFNTKDLDFYVSPVKEKWRAGNFAEATNSITTDHVFRAIRDIDRDGVPADANSTTYDLIVAGKRYPPKYVLSLAGKHANGEAFDRKEFSGGEESPAFALLRGLGFEIERKDAISELVTKFKKQANAATELSVRGYLPRYRDLAVRVSFGKGNFARIRWIAFLADGQEVSEGIYPVLLLFRDQNVLLLCYGVSEENDPAGTWGAMEGVQTVSGWYKTKFGREPDRYGASFVMSAYEWKGELPIADLNAELDRMIDDYKKIIGLPNAKKSTTTSSQESADVVASLEEAVQAFAAALKRCFVDFGVRHDELVAAFVASLITKPLVILTGLSGSGKTQIGMRFGEWLGANRCYIAAVRPDWTGAESLFGYEDGLKEATNGRAAWNVPGPLEFMLNAARDPQHPYLLLLDEMNLAHVERYFADVLSGMESGQECLPNLLRDADGVWRVPVGAPSRIRFPRNLWIVGTVNVDETTYMFSPKVLDRANTFEFRVSQEDLSGDAKKPVACEPGDAALIRGLLNLAVDDGWQHKNPPSYKDELDRRLRQLHGLLARHSLEFGHRAFYEAHRFGAFGEAAGLDGIGATLDRIIVQKVLPRIHGSRRRLEPSILGLMQFCRDLPDECDSDEKLAALNVDVLEERPALPLAYDKLARMLKSLRANQFVSFTE
jgi:5-methylcytosine-specific restriction protein B